MLRLLFPVSMSRCTKKCLPLELLKRCDLNNGDCGHFCEPMGIIGGKCYCAEGYKLMRDGISCEPEGRPTPNDNPNHSAFYNNNGQKYIYK